MRLNVHYTGEAAAKMVLVSTLEFPPSFKESFHSEMSFCGHK